MNESFGLLGVLKVFIKWKKQITVFVGIATAAAAVVTLMIPNYYESMSIFYPTNPALTDRQMLFNDKGSDQYFDYFGSKNDVNRMLAIAYSADVTDFLINEFNLGSHYKIDTTDKLWRWKTKKKLMSNYTAIKNELSAVEITIVDEDREIAAGMANQIVEMIDKLNKAIILKNKLNILSIYKTKKEEKEIETRMFADSLSSMRVRYNIEELESPDGGIISIKGNNANAVEHFKILLRKQYNAIKDLNNVTTVYEQYNATLKDEVSSVFIVEKAHPSEKKKGPLRSLIVISVLLLSLFVALVAALITEKASELNRQLRNGK
jgi:capsular polysaccharide biosynthesis protein